jgi:hypothetical protein
MKQLLARSAVEQRKFVDSLLSLSLFIVFVDRHGGSDCGILGGYGE